MTPALWAMLTRAWALSTWYSTLFTWVLTNLRVHDAETAPIHGLLRDHIVIQQHGGLVISCCTSLFKAIATQPQLRMHSWELHCKMGRTQWLDSTSHQRWEFSSHAPHPLVHAITRSSGIWDKWTSKTNGTQVWAPRVNLEVVMKFHWRRTRGFCYCAVEVLILLPDWIRLDGHFGSIPIFMSTIIGYSLNGLSESLNFPSSPNHSTKLISVYPIPIQSNPTLLPGTTWPGIPCGPMPWLHGMVD